MSTETAYTPPPPRTIEDVEDLVSFIRARVTPLRDAARYDSEEFRAFQSLIDVAVFMHGAAKSVALRGESLAMEYYYLTQIAAQWRAHADFKQSWRP